MAAMSSDAATAHQSPLPGERVEKLALAQISVRSDNMRASSISTPR